MDESEHLSIIYTLTVVFVPVVILAQIVLIM